MTAKTIKFICKNCKEEFVAPYKQRKTRKFCSRTCVNDFQIGEGNPAFGKTYRTKLSHPEWANKISETHKQRGHIIGDKNPMKKKSVAAKMSVSRKKRFQNDEGFRKQHAEIMRNAWKNGKFNGVKVGLCKWYDFIKKNGNTCKVQGLWELTYAKWLDDNDINFVTHKGKLPYEQHGKKKSYYPDFYLPDEDIYVEVKNEYHHSLNKEKIDLVRKHNNVKIKLLFKQDLIQLGIEL